MVRKAYGEELLRARHSLGPLLQDLSFKVLAEAVV